MHDHGHDNNSRNIGWAILINIGITVTEVAKKANKPATLCGEMAGDPQYIPLLVGLGLEDLSMNPASLLEAKKIVRSIEYKHCEQIAKTA